MMKPVILLLCLLCAVFGVSAQTAEAVKRDLSPADIDRVVKAFTANEAEFREALATYAFKRKAMVQIIGLGGVATGTYRRDSHMVVNPNGERSEKIVFFPVATTPPGFITPQDLEDLGGVNPFALEPRSVSHYNFTYVGVERVDDYDLYVFDVTPKVIPNPKKSDLRLFTGRIWVDTKDLMILKQKGKAVPETKDNKFPVVETTRQQIDGKYWFPVDARSDDELVFDNGSVVKIKFRVKYSDYAVGQSEVRILDDEEVLPTPPASPTPAPSPSPKKP
jgi:hypothetical protein